MGWGVRTLKFDVCVLIIAIFSILFIIVLGALQNSALTERKIASLILNDKRSAGAHRSLRQVVESTDPERSNSTQTKLNGKNGKDQGDGIRFEQDQSLKLDEQAHNHLKRDILSHEGKGFKMDALSHEGTTIENRTLIGQSVTVKDNITTRSLSGSTASPPPTRMTRQLGIVGQNLHHKHFNPKMNNVTKAYNAVEKTSEQN